MRDGLMLASILARLAIYSSSSESVVLCAYFEFNHAIQLHERKSNRTFFYSFLEYDKRKRAEQVYLTDKNKIGSRDGAVGVVVQDRHKYHYCTTTFVTCL
ncbi:hypothetical protein BC939DRAFT_458898 [Gamsiella multidivaricata]|uniref:uncharacterized protein n=1 Tax=Gamsiella multidivaricata TaxID=101098 RepID=UPI002220D42C|nr:uncharacterized protein BC939DRAFT_458898 [Gamsiella multidivaricata]KAI7819894.1 hypothetical protein BC939DRAFT_458898 [Gamsiella multidivaricata]